jgi:hypothetical protein
MNELDLNRIYKIVSDFKIISTKYNGKQYFFMRKVGAEKHKYWKYFVKLDKLASKHQIIFPDFFEAQFISHRWPTKKLYPSQLLCDRAMKVWEEFYKSGGRGNLNRVLEAKVADLIELMVNKLSTEVKHEKFISRFFDSKGNFNLKNYYEYKQDINDVTYKIIDIAKYEYLKDVFKEAVELEKNLLKDRLEEWEGLFENKKVFKVYKKIEIIKYNRFVQILKTILKQKKK